MDEDRPPLTGETKTAIGCLALLALQQGHDTLLFVLGSTKLGYAQLGPIAPLAFAITVGTGIGLLRRSRRAWWSAVLLIGGAGLLHLLVCTPRLWHFHQYPGEFTGMTFQQYQDTQDWRLDRFGFFWIVTRGVLLLICPLVLLLGELRISLRPRQP